MLKSWQNGNETLFQYQLGNYLGKSMLIDVKYQQMTYLN